MNVGATVRDPAMRCTAEHKEVPGRTHFCRLPKGHTGSHFCICSLNWVRVS